MSKLFVLFLVILEKIRIVRIK